MLFKVLTFSFKISDSLETIEVSKNFNHLKLNKEVMKNEPKGSKDSRTQEKRKNLRKLGLDHYVKTK